MSDHPIVAGYGGPDSAGAVQLAALLAAALRRPLALVSAYRYEPATLSARVTPSTENELRFEAAQARVQRAAHLVPDGVELLERVVPAAGIPAALADLARELDASLIVTGRDLDGRVTRDLLESAPCPVLVSPLTVALPGEEPPRTIGVAYDDSPASQLAVTVAMHLGVLTGARIRILNVLARGAPAGTEAEAAAATISEAVPAEAEHLRGTPGVCLVDASESLDLLICGSHGRGRFTAKILGSVSGHLVDHALCPVLVIPPGTRHRATMPLGVTTAAG